ncbi:AAA family ATPase [Sphaerimonospora thailandensis]|uniref:Endonuclease GajA/Old nuclease/RecF-like AAA domain-containing protein n=1 Tax=Sphaerimonospora thailandensis TaxID=795644 RepID=A0A8J3R7D5_9ACTN|nr:AAA family ATPase [Sphaerimonospora thailandensis]GIH69344.1 hypothetical protein Mth01_15970 [Sphaerimonospora thailandensis]
MAEQRISELRVENFRSLRQVALPLGPVNVLIGPSGAGKTNVLEVFRLLPDIVRSDLRTSGVLPRWRRSPRSASESREPGTPPPEGSSRAHFQPLRKAAASSLIVLDPRRHVETFLPTAVSAQGA